MNDISIHGDPLYLNYSFDFFTVPVLAACVPVVYLVPTVAIVVKIVRAYIRHLLKKRDDRINHHVFTVIVLHLVLSFCYMLADYASIRIPATGLFTKWCAAQEPNHGIKLIFLLSVYFNYTAMLFPFLLSVLRLVPIFFPTKLEEICARVVRIAIPVMFIYPFFFCFPLIPAVGDCRQLLGSYQFGAIYFYYTGASFEELRQATKLIINAIIWFSACIMANALLYLKLKKMRSMRIGSKLQRAELSLTLITVSMFPSYITNFAFLIGFVINPISASYLMSLRPYGSDCEFVFVAWIFYLTHPIFKKHKIEPKEETRTKRVPVTM